MINAVEVDNDIRATHKRDRCNPGLVVSCNLKEGWPARYTKQNP